MKIRPPWSRRRWTQPATRSSSPTVVGAQLARPVRRGSRWRAARFTARPRSAATRRPAPRRPRALLAALHVLDLDPLAADDHGRARADPVGLLELALQRSAGLLHLGREAAPRAGSRTRRKRRARGRRPRRGRRTPAALLAAARTSEASRMRSIPAAQPTAGRRRAAQLLDEPVVATAAADAALRAERRRSRTRTPCACSSRARARAWGRARRRRRRRRAARAPRRSARRPRARAGRAASARRAITARVPSWSASNARSGFDVDPRAHLVGQLVLARAQVRAQLVDVRARGCRRCRGCRAAAASRACRRCSSSSPEQQDQLGVERGVVGAERLRARPGRTGGSGRPAAPRGGRTGPSTRAAPAAGSLCMPCST